uniref:Uncharacterized protein n=1 Tax=Anopheles christyi TaxID=43041 RepID=A0A182KIH2_9DIPT
MVRRLFRHRTGQLGHLNLALVVTLEASKQHLTLTRLQPIQHARDRAHVIGVGEQYQLEIDKVLVADLLRSFRVQVALLQPDRLPMAALFHVRRQPILTLLDRLLREGEQDRIIVPGIIVAEQDPVPFHVLKVLLRFLRRGRTQTLVVLDVVRVRVVRFRFPLFELRQREE